MNRSTFVLAVQSRLARWVSLLAIVTCCGRSEVGAPGGTNSPEEVTYRLDRKAEIPWSIHVLRIPRHSATLALHTIHAQSLAIGLAPLTEQVQGINPTLGIPIGAINGDFYERQGTYMGDARGLQIVEGELISAAVGSTSFWIDSAGEPHAGETVSQLQVKWPNGSTSAIGLNQERRPNQMVLYTPAVGSSTQTRGGRELVLEARKGEVPLVPLRADTVFHARVREVGNAGNTPLEPETLVLSIGPALAKSTPSIAAGAELDLFTGTLPKLGGASVAISGGPVLIRAGKAQRFRDSGDTYQTASQFERHPRSAIGWNEGYYFLVEVDGRRPRLSVGMTLSELAGYMVKLGCTDAMNLDGGGSATLWYAGTVRNHPCDGYVRPVANAIVVTTKASHVAGAGAAKPATGTASP